MQHDWRRKKKREIIKFAGPALSTVLADPIMSVVDALCVGRFCSTVELASLGPALAVFNFVSYFFFFLNAATCVQVTSSLAARDREQATNVLSDAILLAVGFGTVLAGLVVTFSNPLIASTGCVVELQAIASKYLRVRALGLPLVLVAMVVQSALMGQLDTVTPLQTILIASLLNVLGDIYLVPRLGATGAAWATLWSQIAAFPLLLGLCKLRKRLPVVLRRPKFSRFKAFFNTAGPLFWYEAGMSTCYLLIESLSTHFGVLNAGAFRALWSPLSVLCFFTYPLKQAAQVFLPQILSAPRGEDTVGGEPKVKEFIKVLADLSAWLGVALSVIAIGLTRNPQLFTTDPALWPTMRSFEPYVAALLPVLGVAQVFEGTLIGSDDMKFLSWSQFGNIGVSSLVLLATRRAGMGIYGTWVVFASFLVSRAGQAAARVLSMKKPWAR